MLGWNERDDLFHGPLCSSPFEATILAHASENDKRTAGYPLRFEDHGEYSVCRSPEARRIFALTGDHKILI
jgi:hypothetical protein